MIIDAHQHFWNYDPVRDSWIDDSMQVIRKDFLPKGLRPVLEANNVDGCIAVQADQSEEETEFLLECAKNNPFIKGVVGWLDLRAENIEERLTHYSKHKLFKGVRHIVQAETDDAFMLKPDFLNGINKLEQFGLTYDILIHEGQLSQAVALVEKCPNQQFVLDHIAKPKISNGVDSIWEKHMRALGAYKNVSCKISGMVTETQDFKWQEKDFTPFLDVIVDAFGVDRLLYGSDWPVCLLAGTYGEVIQIVQRYFEKFSKQDVLKVMGENAARIYKLD
ncbi:amidohydrolase family protein [Flavivirga aquimarina]|uniref:Amidohydrolase family protein n=1 Tax=Flavivirga aquimarina TaxID=2027862 RepID=A0ABT8W730_9FLAO|nr:amidohydrolase family protein [Flavivirga aquimarina]MDO5968923.1 amidohydrolase family protein [Flavivirga aquimarina]